MTNIAIGRSAWAEKPLYKFLIEIFPAQRGRYGIFDILGLAKRLGLSGEVVYRWVRSSSLTPRNTKRICNLANSEENLKALAECDPPRKPPVLNDFFPFLFDA